jgi:hypothetical protein
MEDDVRCHHQGLNEVAPGTKIQYAGRQKEQEHTVLIFGTAD